MENLASKYRPRVLEDIVEQSIVVDILKKMSAAENLTCRCFLFTGPAGTGKAQPLYSKVLTPEGYIEMRDVQIGTKVLTDKGNIGKVVGIYPQGVRPIYEITLQDRTKIRVSDEHLNVVYRYNEDKKEREDFCITTTQLIDLFETSRFKLRMDTPSVDFEKAPLLPIDPYLLGALIGDGSLSDNFQFANNEEDVIEKVDSILRRDWGMMLSKCSGDNVDYAISQIESSRYKYIFEYEGQEYIGVSALQDKLVAHGYPKFDGATILRIASGSSTVCTTYPELRDAIKMSVNDNYTKTIPLKDCLRELGLLTKSIDKHIPDMYLTASREDRIRLLQGLFDTDGTIDEGGATTFTTSSARLSDDFAFLVRSLGIRDTVSVKAGKYTKKCESEIHICNDSYEHYLHIPNDLEFCSSHKHSLRRKNRQHLPIRNIVSIEYVGQEECQCIMIDHNDHTYISDDFIPTHNTTTSRALATLWNEGANGVIEIDAASNNGVDAMREIVQQASIYPVKSEYKIFIIDEVHVLSQQAWQVLLKTLEEQPARSIFFLCTTNPEKIPATILSRVQTFQLSKISLQGIHDRLKYVLDCEIAEGRPITYTDDAITYVAKLANGGMRDALTTLDKALAYSNDIKIENLELALSLPNYNSYFDLLNALVKKQNEGIIRMINDVYNSGVNFVKWFEGFHSFLCNIVKYIFLRDISLTMIPSTYEEKISGYGSSHSAWCLQLSNKLVRLIADLKRTQYLQEYAISYLCDSSKREAK